MERAALRESLSDSRVCVIGLGLMGGSLALALRGQCASIAGHDVDPQAMEAALRRGMINRALTNVTNAAGEIDVAILAAPVSAILDWIPKLPALIPQPFHLLDLGSTKRAIVEAMSRLPDWISPLGGHPMCGKEMSGLNAADGDLFRGQVFVLTPLDRTQPATLALAQQLLAAIGARPVILDPERHDRLAAAISHVPYLAAVALIAATAQAEDELAWTLAASGFRDSTRLAASNVTMMLDILRTNRAAVLEGLSRVQASLRELAESIERGDEAGLRALLEASRSRRAEMFQQLSMTNDE